MSNGECWAQGRQTGEGLASSGDLSRGVEPVVSETMVEQVLAAIGRGESLSGIAHAERPRLVAGRRGATSPSHY
jgi:hypothetical protein